MAALPGGRSGRRQRSATGDRPSTVDAMAYPGESALVLTAAPPPSVTGVTLRRMKIDEDAFLSEVLGVMRSGSPSDGWDLRGMEIDFVAILVGLHELANLSVTRRLDNPEMLISVTCTAAEGSSIEDAAEAVLGAWVDRLAYRFHEAHHLAVVEGAAVLRLVTQIGPAGLYVTAQVSIRPSGG